MTFNLKGWRKYSVALLCILLTFVLALKGVVDGSQWVAAVGLIVGLFGGFNVGEHLSKRGGGGSGDGLKVVE